MGFAVNGVELTQDEIDEIEKSNPFQADEPEEVDDEPNGRQIQEPLTEAEEARILATDESVTGGYVMPDHVVGFGGPHGEWNGGPVARQRERDKFAIGSHVKLLDDTAQRLRKITRWGDALPTDIAKLSQKSRLAIGAATTAIEDGASASHGGRKYAKDTAAKDLIVTKVATAVASVGACEAAFSEPHVAERMVGAITKDLPKQREAAQKALDAAVKAFSAWRSAISTAEALNVAAGVYGPNWHKSKDSQSLRPGEMLDWLTKTRDLAHDPSPYWSGEYLSMEIDGVPAWTMEALKAAAELAPGSMAESVYHRLNGRIHLDDYAARETIARRDLRIINTEPIPILTPEGAYIRTGPNEQSDETRRHARALMRDHQFRNDA